MKHRLTLLLAATTVLSAQSPAKPVARPVMGVDRAYMDTAVAPCADFYRYANGAYDKAPIPGAYSAFGVNQEIDERNEAILKEILDLARDAKAAPAGGPLGRIRDFYGSGMDEAAIEGAGLKPLAEAFGHIEGATSAKELARTIAWLHVRGVRAGFAFSVGVDDKDSSAVIAQLGQAGMGLPERDFYFRDDDTTKAQRKAYVAHVGRMLALSGFKPAAAESAAIRVMALETELARVAKTLMETRDPEANYNKLDREAFAKAAPGFDWAAYFEGIGLPAFQKHLNVGQPAFFKGFADLALKTSLEDWRLYLRWYLMRGAASSMGRAIEEEAFAFYGKTLSGRTEMLPRWKRILRATDFAIGEDLGQLYVQRAFSPEAKARVLEMIRFHKDALRQSIQRATWMGEATKRQALRKLDTMQAKVGYPDRWRDYSEMALKAQPFVLNVEAAQIFEFKRRMAKLGKPVDRAEWLMTPQTNNAYYEPTLNEIALPAGILQPPFFDVKADDASNYGALASTIGHEILHGFDDQGSLYDAEGNLKSWWSPGDRKAYEAQTEQVVKQYDAFEPLPGLHIQGKQTLGENLADIGGLKISFEAWKLATAGRPQATLDGLRPEQRFFVAFAQGWRTNMRPESIRLQVQSDVHSPIRERVLGPVSALPDFQRAFGCQEGDPMSATKGRRFGIW